MHRFRAICYNFRFSRSDFPLVCLRKVAVNMYSHIQLFLTAHLTRTSYKKLCVPKDFSSFPNIWIKATQDMPSCSTICRLMLSEELWLSSHEAEKYAPIILSSTIYSLWNAQHLAFENNISSNRRVDLQACNYQACKILSPILQNSTLRNYVKLYE